MNTTTTFKRLAVGTNFNWKGVNYRKVTNNSAFRLKENGRGDTANYIPFTRSAAVTIK